MGKQETDRKAIDKMNRIQQKYGGRSPEYIIMFFAERLDCLTRVLIGLTGILAVLTVVHIYLLVK